MDYLPIKHKQPGAKNCGIYALANVLNEDSFVKEENLQGGEDGLRIEELNELLKKEGMGYFIDPIYVDRCKLIIPADFELYPIDNKIITGLMVVKYRENSLWHCIGFRIYSDKTVRVLDSLLDETFVTSWHEISKMYHSIEGVYCFTFYDKKIEGYVCLE